MSLAATANAAYSPEPLALPWNPAGGVHASTTGNGVVYLGGKLDGTGGIAAVDATTGALLWLIPADNDVRALALSTDGTTLYAGGKFKTIDGVTHRHLVAINVADHSLDAAFKGTAAGMVRDLMFFGNDLYVAGKVTKVGGLDHRGIGAVDATTGAADASFTFQADNDVFGLAMTGTRLILSGSFTKINGSSRDNLAMIDLATGTLTRWAPDRLCYSCNQEFDVATDGVNAYVAGTGNTAGAYSLATGQEAWPSIHGTGDFQTIALPGDGEVYFGGHFGLGVWTGRNSKVMARGVVAVSATTGQIDPSWAPMLYTAYPGVWAMTPAAGNLWVGGDFTGEQVNGLNNKKPYLAAYPGI